MSLDPIHPLVQDLLDLLLKGPLVALGAAAIAAIRDADLEADPEERDASGPRRPKGRRQRGYRQLDLVDATVTGALKRELILTARLAEIAPEFGIETLDIVMPRVEGGGVDRLLAPQRREAILEFLKLWEMALGQTRQALETDSGE
jgi:hypothetical protein